MTKSTNSIEEEGIEAMEDKKELVNPELAGGFKDYLPQDMIPRQKMLDTIREVFERFGFLPLDTPGIEKEEVLTGGDPNFRMQIFRAGLRGGDEGLALRFDLTVPLARVMSLYGDQIEKPFKRYQVGKVWRGEKPQAGRFREFIQFDADTVGSNRMSADAEIISLIYSTMSALGIERFMVKVNNRKILNGLSEFVGYDHSLNVDVLRTIDKLDKIAWEGVSKELSERIGLDQTQLERLKEFLELRTPSQKETLDKLAKLMEKSSEAMQGIAELREMMAGIEASGVPEDYWQIDLSVARGLGYYTGPVFETILLDLPGIGSVFSGGRYDGLVSRFSQQKLPATGASVGVDRLFAALEKMGLVKKEKTTTQVLVLNFDPQVETYCQKVVSMIRQAGISAELYLGKETILKGQLAYGVKMEIPVVIIAGSTEKDEGMVQIKDMAKREQRQVPLNEILTNMKNILT